MSTDRLASRGPPPVTLSNFVEYAKAKHKVFSVDDGEKRKEMVWHRVCFAPYLEFLLLYIQYVLFGGADQD